MNKKILLYILSCALPATPLFAMQPGSSLYPDPFSQLAAVAPMQKLDYVDIPLKQPSIDAVSRTSKWSTLVGTCAGLGAGYYVLENHGHQLLQQQTELFRKIAIPTVATIVATGAGYYIGNVCATYNTPEKIDQRKANTVISNHNEMLKASEAVGLNEESRTLMNLLPFDGRGDDDRLYIYQNISVGENSPMPINTPIYPIHDRTNYVTNLASKLKAEKIATDTITNDALNEVTNSRFLQENNQGRNIADNITLNQRHIRNLNARLPHERLSNWASYVKNNAPEYLREKIRQDLHAGEKILIEQEDHAFYNLARIASLHGCLISKQNLASTLWQEMWITYSTQYNRTRAGERARLVDIAQTKDDTSSIIQDYQEKNELYNQKIHTHDRINVSENIKTFVLQQGGNIDNFPELRATNKTLLAFNRYLNHRNANFPLHIFKEYFEIR